MYETLDEFTVVKTWASLHWADEERFLRALDKIARNRGFSASKVGEYVERQYVKQYGQEGDSTNRELNVEHYTELAHAVWKYLRATGQLS